MRAELPWNVAGIPPEAREAARAAARREGLSVGEWLTRRIISELGPDAAIPPSTAESGPDVLPAAHRTDTEQMLARLAQAEADASHTYRRIEEQLRSVGSGLDNAERSQSESNRAMSRAASEITLAGHEQAQAFDQLGGHIMELGERLERLERTTQLDGLKEAVKGLHQGLSRLADQFGQTTARNGGQVASLARNLEQLALRLVQARADADAAAQTLQAQVARVEARAEESHQLTAGMLAQVLERIEAQGALHDQDLADTRRREAEQRMSLAQVEERIVRLEAPDLDLDRRLDAIEQGLAAIGYELEKPDPHAGLADALRRISVRLDILEQSHADLMAEFKAAQAEPVQPEPPAISTVSEAESPPVAAAPEEEPAMLLADEPPAQEVPPREASPDDFVQHAFANHFEMSKDFAEALAQPRHANEQEILESALRSAQAATNREAEPSLHSMSWTRPSLREEKARPNYLAILAAVFLLMLAAAAALMLNQGSGQADNPGPLPPSHAATGHRSVAAVAPRLPAPQIPAPPAAAPLQDHMAAASTTAMPTPPPPSADKVLAAANDGNVTAEALIGLEYLDAEDTAKAMPWLKKAAEAGQPVAQYRLGTLYERGQGVEASPALAVKWYLAAAAQGNRKAMHNLAVAYADGSAGTKDMQEAARWFAKAAQLGLSDSQFNLAVLYERGTGVPQSLADAYKWYAIAAAQGDVESKMRLSILKSQLSDSDRTAAERAAQSFRPDALTRLANLPPEAGDIGG